MKHRVKKINWRKIYHFNLVKTILLVSFITWFFSLILYDGWQRPWDESIRIGLIITLYLTLLYWFFYLRWKIAFLFFLLAAFLFIPVYSTGSKFCEIKNLKGEEITVFINCMGQTNKKVFKMKEHAVVSFRLPYRDKQKRIYPIVALNKEGKVVYKDWMIINGKKTFSNLKIVIK